MANKLPSTQPNCDYPELLSPFTADEVIDDAMIGDRKAELARQASEERLGGFVKKLSNDQRLNIDQKTVHKSAGEATAMMAEGAAAAAELMVQDCVSCPAAVDCEIKSVLSNRANKGENAYRAAQTRFVIFTGVGQYKRWFNNEQSKDQNRLTKIEKSQAAQHRFAGLVEGWSKDPTKRDELVTKIYNSLANGKNGREEQQKFVPFMTGVVCESVASKLTQDVASTQNWTFREATKNEDIKEGTDFLLITPETNTNPSKEVRIDAKSKTQYEKMTQASENIVDFVGSGTYAAIVERPGYERVLVVNPEGRETRTAVIAPGNGKAWPSYEINDRTAINLKQAIEAGVVKM